MAELVSLNRATETAGFLARVGPFLERNEEENSIVLGLLQASPPQPSVFMADVAIQGEPVLAAHYSGYRLLLGGDESESLAPILTALAAEKLDVLGVVARNDLADAFSERWTLATGCSVASCTSLRIYAARRVIPPDPPPGRMGLATLEDLHQVADWFVEFQQEALPSEPLSHEKALLDAGAKIEKGMVFLWKVDGRVVSMSAFARATRNTITVNSVYTPLNLRKRGYASALVAALAAEGLNRGNRAVVLYADLMNPASNAIYLRIGFEAVCDSRNYRFDYRK